MWALYSHAPVIGRAPFHDVTMVAATVRTAWIPTCHYVILFLLRIHLPVFFPVVFLLSCLHISHHSLPFVPLAFCFASLFSFSVSFFHLRSKGQSALTATSPPALPLAALLFWERWITVVAVWRAAQPCERCWLARSRRGFRGGAGWGKTQEDLSDY